MSTINGTMIHPDVVLLILLKIEGPMVQTCRNINVHLVNTDICWEWDLQCFNVYGLLKKADSSICTVDIAKLKIVYKTGQQKH